MRFLIFLLTLIIAPAAAAQDAPSISGFRLGMSIEEARAVNMGVQWPYDFDRPFFEAQQVGHSIGDHRFTLSLVIKNGVIDHIGGGGSAPVASSDECDARVQSVLSVFERSVGPMGASERDAGANDIEPIRTPAGSYVRRWGAPETGVGLIATATTPAATEIRAWSTPRGEGFECFIMFGMNNDEPAPADIPQSTITGWTWVVRPDAARYYPEAAMIASRPGDVTMLCTVTETGAMQCRVAHDSAPGWGFSEAGLRASRRLMISQTGENGAPTAGETIRMTMRFRPSY